MNSIAIIEPVGGHGGMNYYDFGLARGLSASDCKVFVYTSEETIVTEGLPFIVKKTFKGIWGKTPKLLRAFRFVYCLFTSLRDAKINNVAIVHYHFFHYTSLESLCVKLAKMYGFKVVVTAHDVESFSGERDVVKAREILLYSNKVIAHNEVSKNELVSKISLPLSLISVIPHGNYLDSITDFPKKTAARRAIGFSSSDKIILFFGQIKKVKGLDVLLRSLPEVIQVYPDVKLVIAGKVWKDDFSFYEKIIKENCLDNNIISHIHYIPDDAVENYYCSADLIVLPYKKIYQSGVLLMAMSYKVPVLTSDIAGMTEIITDNKNGYIFESENEKSLSSKLIDIFSKQKQLMLIGKEGFNTVKRDYDWNKIGFMTSEVYRELDSDE